LQRGISGQSAGRYDGKAAPQRKVRTHESRYTVLAKFEA
jgi:hypothetical protein